MSDKLNVVIGKIGKSCKFKRSTWSATGGANEAPIFFSAIAKHNPDVTFYLIGRSDYSRLTDEEKKEVCVNGNFVDIWTDFKKGDNAITYPYRYFKERNIKVDLGLIYGGSVASVNIPNLVKKKNKDEYVGVLETYRNYAAPIVHYFNESKIKYITLVPDPRYIPIRAEDILNPEKISLTLFDGVANFKRMKSFEEQDNYVDHRTICKYTGIETAYLLDSRFEHEPNLIYTDKKNIKLGIFHNEGGVKELYRGKVITDYVLKQFPDAIIYGKWKDKWLEDSRFKGELKFDTLQDLLPTVKYTFMVPIERDTLSMKFWESIHNEIIPFMHKYYDESNYTKCPEFLRIKDEKDLLDKINYLEDNLEEYKKLMKQLKDMLIPEMYDGRFMNQHVQEAVKQLKNM